MSDSDKVVSLARNLKVVQKRWEPEGQEDYEDEVRRFIAVATKDQAVKVILKVLEAGSKGEVPGPFASYPLLRDFVERFRPTPSLLVQLYNSLAGAGGKALPLASDYLKRAYELDPENVDVLWELFKSHHFTQGIPHPSFPVELKLSPDDLEHERIVLRRIVSKVPDNNMAATILKWLEASNICYHRSGKVPISLGKIDMATRPTATRSMQQLLRESDP